MALEKPEHTAKKGANMDWGGGHMYGWGGGIMIILWVVLIAALAFWMIRLAQKTGAPASGHESAIDILKKRYARGEISKQEFEERKRDL